MQRASRYLTHVLVLFSVVAVPALNLGLKTSGHQSPVLTAYGASGPVSLDRGFMLKPDAVNAAPVKRDVQTYAVQDGDTLSGIAEQFGLSVDTLRWANDLSDIDTLALGQQLLIPPTDGVLVTVKAGDTVASLAAKYSVPADTLIQFNLVADPDHLVAGTHLMVPGGNGPALPPSSNTGNSGDSSGSSSFGPLYYSSGPNHFPWGQCTWYVASRRYIPWNGDAHTWYGNARAYGYPVGQYPRVGAIMVTWESWWGHVAYVEAVDGRCWTVSEMNYRGLGIVDRRTICFGQVPLIGFVY